MRSSRERRLADEGPSWRSPPRAARQSGQLGKEPALLCPTPDGIGAARCPSFHDRPRHPSMVGRAPHWHAVTRAWLVALGIVLAACGTSRAPSVPVRGPSGGASSTTTGKPTPSATSSSATAVAGASATLACGGYAYRPQSSDLASDISATGTDCLVARRVVAAAPDRPTSGLSYKEEGSRCTAGPESQPPDGGMSTVPYRCESRGGGVVTFRRY